MTKQQVATYEPRDGETLVLFDDGSIIGPHGLDAGTWCEDFYRRAVYLFDSKTGRAEAKAIARALIAAGDLGEWSKDCQQTLIALADLPPRRSHDDLISMKADDDYDARIDGYGDSFLYEE